MAPSKPASSKALSSKSSSTNKKSAKSTVGAPSQHSQSSRKGKRAWRKNVNIEDVEEGLEEMRAEERVIGTALQKTTDKELFQIDVTGDSQIRKSLPRFSSSQLTSAKILAQRSAIPAVFSRPSTATNKRKSLSHEEKERLLRIAKRPRKGPFNAVIDPSELGSGSAIVELSEAVKKSGTYDAWELEEVVEVKDGLETVQVKKIKAPVFPHPRDTIEVPAILEPHQGASYNPPVEAHHALLLQAAEVEEKRIREKEKTAEVKAKIDKARAEEMIGDEIMSGAPGMRVDDPSTTGVEEDEVNNEEDVEPAKAKKQPERKTTSQRKKAARLLAEKRALADRAANKRLLASISGAKGFRRTGARLTSQQESVREKKHLEVQEALRKHGLAGKRLGRHKVPEGEVEVQLGEDLSESFRELKPEGNLFRDRFLSLQQRALIEPRVPVLPKKRRNKIIEYEKHAWKRFT